MNETDLQQLDELITRRIGTFAEDVQHKLDLVIEGQNGLGERMDRMEGRMDHLEVRMDVIEVKIEAVDAKLSAKIDSVAANLEAHRRDTEAHRGYRVGE